MGASSVQTVLLQGRIAADNQALLRQYLSNDWQITVWDPRLQSHHDFERLAFEADVIVGGNIPTNAWPETPKLKLFQIPWTGYNFTAPEKMPAGVPVCNCYGHESAIAEYVMLGMLEWQLGLRRMDQRWRAHGWHGRLPAAGEFHGEVRGKTVGIVGYGHIGDAVARRAAAFGMDIIGIRRSVHETPEPLRWLGGMDRLDELLGVSDFLLLACDLNDETRNLINADRLKSMKSTGVVINIARGEVVDEAALFDALVNQRIGGAILDVWYNYNSVGAPEVWPANFPFQGLDNVILSAHESGWTKEQVARRWRNVAANIERATQPQTLENIVFTGTAAPGAALA